ncbi:hypothetical protein HWB76_gp066 [Streptomyces phage Blueeyedbeauty]|uniref:Lipoprotein n=1 Tax=Streptomyces phage Blueeyedbeauty TaxID=2250336 RepID=A0A345L232_9CAUD|nr:hypothetical protein HWB76_gp066 [Streptomyces phage Blueeyedbeauty]AXH49334.1 hypothetical protein SEA_BLUEEYEDBEAUTY_227 [Streptomyces phage Blueeyedbeauty]
MIRIVTGIVLVVLGVVVSCLSEQQNMAVMMGVVGVGFLFVGMLDKPEPTE